MNQKTTLIAVLCGVIASWMFLSQTTLGGLGAILSSFTAFPLFVSVLGFGTVAGIISGAVAAIVIALFFGPLGAAIILLFSLGPALWIGHMVGLSRNDTGQVEWFPISDLVFRFAGMCAAIAIILGIVTGYSTEAAQTLISEVLTRFIDVQSQAGGGALTVSKEQIAARSAVMASLLPVAFPASLFLLLSANLVLAERFVRKRGWMMRPKDHLPTAVSLPIIAVPIFAAAILVAFASGSIGDIGKVVAGAFGAAFIAVGLATIHAISAKWSARGLLLFMAYFSLLFSTFTTPAFALLGVAETILQIRARFGSGSSHSNT